MNLEWLKHAIRVKLGNLVLNRPHLLLLVEPLGFQHNSDGAYVSLHGYVSFISHIDEFVNNFVIQHVHSQLRLLWAGQLYECEPLHLFAALVLRDAHVLDVASPPKYLC